MFLEKPYHIEEAFTSQFCDNLLHLGEQKQIEEAKIKDGNQVNRQSKVSWIKENMLKGERYKLCYYNDVVIGTAALKIKGRVLTIKHLAVLPKFWGLGIGSFLLKNIITHGNTQKLLSINLGLIDDNDRLKKWYKSFGFNPCKSKLIKGLPYKITFMKMYILVSVYVAFNSF